MDHRPINTIKGLSERRRLPRLGKIRLGIKRTGAAGAVPTEVDYFVCPPEVQRVYGPRPTALRIMIPVEDTSQVFPQAYKWYGLGSGLKCKGDGQIALRRWADVEPDLKARVGGMHEPNDLVEIPCPCPRLKTGECGVKAHLMVLLPDVSLSGVYQLDTGSVWNLIEVNSSLDFLRALLGRVALVPLRLRREPVELVHEGKRRLHHLLKLSFDGDLQAVQRVRDTVTHGPLPPLALPIPSDEGLDSWHASRPAGAPEADLTAPEGLASARPAGSTPATQPSCEPRSDGDSQIRRTGDSQTRRAHDSEPRRTGPSPTPERSEPTTATLPPPPPRSAQATNDPLPNGRQTGPDALAPAGAAGLAPAKPEGLANARPEGLPSGRPEGLTTVSPTDRPHPKDWRMPDPKGRRTPDAIRQAPEEQPRPITSAPPSPVPPEGLASARPASKTGNAGGPRACACGAVPSDNVADYSQRYFGKVMCLPCQKQRFGTVTGPRTR